MLALRFRWAVVVASLVRVRRVASTASRKVKQSFFPPATRPQFMVDVFLPAGTHIRETEAFAERVAAVHPGRSRASRTSPRSSAAAGCGSCSSTRRRGRTGRSCSSWSTSTTANKIDGLIADIQKHLDDAISERQRRRQKVSARARARAAASRLASAAPIRPCCASSATRRSRCSTDDGGAVCVRSDWREREKVIRPDLLELQARRNGITRVEVAQALETSFEGRVVGFYREPGSAGGGVVPAGDAAAADRRPPAAGRARGRVGASTACRFGARSPGG